MKKEDVVALQVKELDSLRKELQKHAHPARWNADPRDVQKSVTLKVNPDTLAKTKSVRVAVSFENSEGVVQHQEQTIEVDASDAQSLTVNLKINS